MADAVAPVDPAALADVIRRCEAAVASWDVGDIEARALLGDSADFPTAIRDAAPLVLAVERHVRDARRSVASGAASSSPREVRVARSENRDDVSEPSSHADTNRGKSEADRLPSPRAAAAERSGPLRGATVVELCGPERGRLLGWLVRALVPVEAVEEVVLVDDARPPRRGDGTGAGAEPEESLADDARSDVTRDVRNRPVLTTYRANVKNASHLRRLAESVRRATTAERRSGVVFVARRLAGTTTLRACQLFDASFDRLGGDDASVRDGSVHVPVTLLLEPGDAPPKRESLKSKLLFRVARAHACAARQLYPAPDANARDEPLRGINTVTAACSLEPGSSPPLAPLAAARTRRRDTVDAEAKALFFAHVVEGLRTTPGARAVAFEAGATRFAVARRRGSSRDGARSVGETSRDPFGPVAWTITEQMAQLNAAVARRLGEADGYVRPSAPPSDGERSASAAAARKPFFAFASPPRASAGAPESNARLAAGYALRRVAPSRWSRGGYAAEHYVKPDPEPHGVCYEAVCVDARGAELLGPASDDGLGAGFVSVTAHEGGGAFFGAHHDAVRAVRDDVRTAPIGRVLTHAKIERLCVKDGFRGVGVAQTLLRVADGFHACGVPVRVKTASERARASFANMPEVLAFVGFKDPTAAGVSKKRGARVVVVVDDASGHDANRRDTEKTETREPETERETETQTERDVSRAARMPPPRWGADPEDDRAYAIDGWGKKGLKGSESDFRRSPDDASSETARTRTRVDSAVRETVAAMNRAAPDTVDSCAARVSRAVSVKKGEGETVSRLAATAAGAAFARRAAREPMYAPTHARVLRRVESQTFREKATDATLQTLRRLCERPKQERATINVASDLSRDEKAEGAAAFAAALVAERADARDLVTATERARAENAVAATLARLGDVADTSNAALFALCAAIDRGAMATSGAGPVAAMRARLLAVAERRRESGDESGDVSGSGARFAAERARDTLGAGDGGGVVVADLGCPPGSGFGPRSASTAGRVGFGRGRGRAPPRAQSRAETHAAAEAEAAGRRAVAREDDDKKRRVPAAPPLRVAAAGSIAAVERGMRQGWVFRYVGSGVAPRDEAYWTR